MNDIEKKQYYLVSKTKKYFKFLKLKGIDLSKSSLCYLSTYGINPGHANLLIWLNKKNSIFFFLRIILKHLFAISSFYNYQSSKLKTKKFKNIFICWGRKKNFKKEYYQDDFLNIRSDKAKNSLFFVILIDNKKPIKIPKNVVVFYKKNKSRSILFLISTTFYLLIKYNFNFRKIFHYLSSQTVFAELINNKILEIHKRFKFNQVILPYEGQPFQNYLFKNLKKLNVNTIGIIHSILPALPLNLMKRDGSPDKIYISGVQQKKILVKLCGWKNNEILLNKSLRLKYGYDKRIIGSIFFPINLNKIDKLINTFENLVCNSKIIKYPKLKIRNHPQMKDSLIHKILEKEFREILKNCNREIYENNKINICIFIGTTSSILEYLAKNLNIIHIPINKELDVYSESIWKGIKSIEKNNIFYYKIAKKNNLVKFSDEKYSFLNLKLI